jgi:hypothetical protein
MKGEAGERWQLLCKLAAEEQNPEKLLELAAAIDRLLAEKQERLERSEPNPSGGIPDAAENLHRHPRDRDRS